MSLLHIAIFGIGFFLRDRAQFIRKLRKMIDFGVK